jgi:hypothetical protein
MAAAEHLERDGGRNSGNPEQARSGLGRYSCVSGTGRVGVSPCAAADRLGGTGDLLITIFELVAAGLHAKGVTAERLT